MTSTPASELGRTGQLVGGKFRLDAIIGQGGMGSVWSATHLGLGHRVAVKLIAREFVRSPEALRRFDAEAKAAARLQSRHVVQVFDNGTLEDGTPYIAMELLAGENLSDRIAKTGPFALAQTVEILAQCCKALGRAHAAGIVHRDIKPDNLFLAQEPDADRDVVKILDFGVAKVTLGGLERGPVNSHATGTGTLLGTPLFMSPEQIRGSREVDHRTDLYSLGLVAYTMLTGQMAVAGDTFGDILIKVCTEPLPRLRAAAPSLPHGVDTWFQRTCAREAGDRCQSAQEFIDTLRAAAGDAPQRATPSPQTPALPTLQSADRRNQSAPAFGQSAAAVSVTAAGVPRRPIGPLVAGGILAVLFAAGGAVLLAFSPSHREPTEASVLGAAAVSPKLPELAPGSPKLPELAPAPSPSAFAQPAAAPLAVRDAGSSSASAPTPRNRAPEVATPQPRPFVPAAAPTSPATATTSVRIPAPAAPPRPTAPINVGY